MEFKLWQLKVLQTCAFSEVSTLVRMIWLWACILTWLNSGSGRNTPLLLRVTPPSIVSLSWRAGLCGRGKVCGRGHSEFSTMSNTDHNIMQSSSIVMSQPMHNFMKWPTCYYVILLSRCYLQDRFRQSLCISGGRRNGRPLPTCIQSKYVCNFTFDINSWIDRNSPCWCGDSWWEPYRGGHVRHHMGRGQS